MLLPELNASSLDRWVIRRLNNTTFCTGEIENATSIILLYNLIDVPYNVIGRRNKSICPSPTQTLVFETKRDNNSTDIEGNPLRRPIKWRVWGYYFFARFKNAARIRYVSFERVEAFIDIYYREEFLVGVCKNITTKSIRKITRLSIYKTRVFIFSFAAGIKRKYSAFTRIII